MSAYVFCQTQSLMKTNVKEDPFEDRGSHEITSLTVLRRFATKNNDRYDFSRF